MTYKVQLPVFEGPLDLLLHLIKKEEIDVYDIPVAHVTQQYLEHLEIMQMLDLEIAGEFILMAATLMHIKSKMLLPESQMDEEITEEQGDPREELVKRLLEYKKFKDAATNLKEMKLKQQDTFTRLKTYEKPKEEKDEEGFEASLFDLITAFTKVLKEVPKSTFHEVVGDEFKVSDKIHDILHTLVENTTILFSKLFKGAKNKSEIVAIFLAILELVKIKEIAIKQSDHFGEIEVMRSIEWQKK